MGVESVKDTIKYYKRLIQDFDIVWTPELENKIIDTYPNLTAIENYMLSKILKHLEEYETT